MRRTRLSPTRAFLAWWPLAARNRIAAGRKPAGYPLDRGAILARYRSVHDDYPAFNAEENHDGGDPRTETRR